MLEARLLVKLAGARTMWHMHHTNDAQDIISDAVNMAVDTKWEDEITTILIMPGMRNYEDIMTEVLSSYPGVTKENIYDTDEQFHYKHPDAITELRRLCSESDKQYEDYVSGQLDYFIESLTNAISDKIHRRNLQIADLKRKLGNAVIEIDGIFADINAEQLDRQTATLKERIGRIRSALLT